jgi:hypothetical protein
MTVAVALRWLITTRKINFARANNRRLVELQGNRVLTHNNGKNLFVVPY